MKILDNDIKVDVIGFGALNVDKLHEVDSIACIDEESFIKSEKDTPGGSAANTIIGLSKLGFKTSIIGKIGEDSEGDLIELNLSSNGVYTNNLIYSDKGSTGKVLGFVDKKGNRSLYVNSGVNDEIAIGEINPKNVNTCKILHYTSFVGDSFKTQIELLDKINEDILLSFDPGMLYVKKGIKELLPILKRTNILLINEKELRLLFEDYYKIIDSVDDSLSIKEIAIHILDDGIETVVVKKGESGVFAINSNEECFVNSFKTKVLDTTGAGDSFNSGFLYGILNNYSLKDSCIIANWVASKSIEGFGIETFPLKKQLLDFENSF